MVPHLSSKDQKTVIFLERLINLIFLHFSLIVDGDFNAVLGPLDYQGWRKNHSNVEAREVITVLMEEFNLFQFQF